MNPILYVARLGVGRGWHEFKIGLRGADETGFKLVFALSFALVLYFQRNATVEGTTQSLASVVLPSILGMMVVVGSALGGAGALSVEREDGTLLRAKAIPNGMIGYFAAKVTSVTLDTVIAVTLVLATGLIFVPELLSTGYAGWLALIGILGLGLLATLPWGAVIGSVVLSPQSAFGLTMLPIGAITAISGIFYPITALAGWVQGIAQVFPVYWLGHGTRWALLPDSAAAAEIGGSWRPLETAGVLAAWAVAGLLVAPPVLRTMARRESGSAIEARRHRAMQRVG
ncbi:ABC transporter permease [Phytoactinopolyspora alkaliphila]|uniref:ABC transporter permease n=1 Tax=Phytoactinopolyspora alkaliphila TaxID=1783498 RepID=A0A6N9YIS1_9ACTN|nr:ABC transporter permease [Phytoactinopolyspora alkaliphila]NED94906.1 ABC transporter permease [Phytoactinopolyspora alkaliphila]